ncbi:hypothetical protein GCM10010313_12570 [Streptomyces violarus]|uniref:L-alanine-DL-glutamate epimerase-like enolase superfamily enzyme n=1 Tax=Streptomyces violarus TaxID=67380 RepID=A0A7W5EZY1_9ACTN|nr:MULTISPECIES: hypothetical protein [Streptomyces]MBB3074793.1 L-alanine-DL-glutamate epimerase-like enolase superfamily enzyme [Streptomyces violarus]WRT97452.1 hypothetical protein VJ737_07040 [Streptomyces sp. CGMCC 4.1772]GHD00811.1 hypothetical protein GCM10010313_12570 [Streptomyces violarus]
MQGAAGGREVARDLRRARAAHHVIGDEAELYVDANGALGPAGGTVHPARGVGHGLTLRTQEAAE